MHPETQPIKEDEVHRAMALLISSGFGTKVFLATAKDAFAVAKSEFSGSRAHYSIALSSYDAFNQSVTIKFYFRCRRSFSGRKKPTFFLKSKLVFYKNQFLVLGNVAFGVSR